VNLRWHTSTFREFPKLRNDVSLLFFSVTHVAFSPAGSWKLRPVSQVQAEVDPLGRCLERRGELLSIAFVKDFAGTPDCRQQLRKLQNLHVWHIEAARRSSAQPNLSAETVLTSCPCNSWARWRGSCSSSRTRTGRQNLMRSLKCRDRLLSGNRWERVKKLIETMPSFEIVKEVS